MKDLEDKEKFIQLRAKGLSFDKIAKQIKISKPTLLKWSAEFLDYSESKKLDSLSTIGNYISLNLNSLLSEILSNSLKVQSGLQKNLTDYQLEICEIMECEDFDFLKIHKKQNKIESYEFQKSFSPSIPDSEIKKRYKDYEVSEKVVNGKVSSRTRTVRKKI